MDYQSILSRIRAAVASSTYQVPTAGAPPSQREALAEIAAAIERPDADPDWIARRIHQLHAAGKIDRVMKLSALGVLAASPLVGDLVEAARLASQQEFAALDEGGPWRDGYLASADRHRGVIAFLRGYPEVALDWFTRALERERTAENVGNVLVALVRLGEVDEAARMYAGISPHLPVDAQRELVDRVATDDDLIRLRRVTAR
ncbi:MAG: hypothetical protein ABMA64_16605 [Myxococcota bacterium]